MNFYAGDCNYDAAQRRQRTSGCIAAGMAISYSYTAAMYGFDQANSDLLFSAGLVGTAALAGVVVRVLRSADGAIQYFDDAGRPLDQGIVDMLKSQNKLALDPDNPDQLIIPSQKPINDSAIDRVDDALRTGGGSAPNKTGATSAADAIKLKRSLESQQIAGGHAFDKHVLGTGEFSGLGIRTRKQFSDHIYEVTTNPTATKSLGGGRTGYYHQPTGTIVVKNPKSTDGGTAFRPSDPKKYFDESLQ